MALLVFVTTLVVARSGVLRHWVEARLAEQFNCRVRCAAAVINIDGSLTVRRPRLVLTDLDGPAARFLQADSLTVGLDWWTVVRGAPEITRVRVRSPRLRISQGEGYSLNLARLRWRGGDGATTTKIPTIEIERGVVELGEHGASAGESGYRKLAELPVEGACRPREVQDGWYDLRFEAEPDRLTLNDQADEFGVLELDGWIDMETKSALIEMKEVDLSFFAAQQAPRDLQDLWRQMDIRGRVTQALLLYSPEQGLHTRLELDGVDLNVPIPRADDMRGERWLAMTGVSGRIDLSTAGLRANLSGRAQDLDCRVMLRTEGPSLDADFECSFEADSFVVASQPELLPFAPDQVRKLLRRFSGPTGVVSAQVEIKRATSQSGETDVGVTGRVSFVNGRAAYTGFPYPVENISGEARFDENRLDLVSLAGTGLNGGTVTAHGIFEPLGPDAGFHLTIEGSELPVDEHLFDALESEGREVVESLLDREMGEALVARGLSPTEAAVPGGNVSMKVELDRPRGGTMQSTDLEVTLRINDAWLLPSRFPLPARARDQIVRIRRDGLEIPDATLTTPGGGVVRVSGRYAFDGNHDESHIDIVASDLPVNERLRFAAFTGAAGGREAGRVAEKVIDRMGFDGVLGFDAWIDGEGLHCTVPIATVTGAGGDAELRNLGGAFRLTPDAFIIDGVRADWREAVLRLDASVPVEQAPSSSPWTCQLLLGGVDVRSDLDAMIDWLDDVELGEIRTRIEAVRDVYEPRGRVDVALSIRPDADSDSFIMGADIVGMDRLTIESPLGPLTLTSAGGVVGVEGETLTFRNLQVNVMESRGPVGQFNLNGMLTPGERLGGRLRVEATGARIGSNVIQTLMRRSSETLDRMSERFDPRGVFDAELSVAFEEAGEVVEGVVRPSRLDIAAGGMRLAFESMSGAVHVSPERVEFVNLGGVSDSWSFNVSGGTNLSPERTDTDLQLSLDGRGAPESLIALLPQKVRDPINGLGLDVSGVFSMRDARLRLDGDVVGFEGVVSVSGAQVDTLLPVRQLSGRVEIVADSTAETPIELRVAAESLRIGAADSEGIPLEAGRLHVMRRSNGWTAPLLEARIGDGMITGEGVIRDGAASRGAYEWSMSLTDLPLGRIFRRAAGDEQSERLTALGRLDGSLSVTGDVGEASSAKGRGFLRIRGGDLLAGTGLLPLLELSSLSVPSGQKMDFAYVDFHIDGDDAIVDGMQMYAENARGVVVQGIGGMTWTDLELDLRFTTRSRTQVPGISDVFEGLRDELATATIRGSLVDPEIGFETLTATRELWESIFRGERPPEDARTKPVRSEAEKK